MYSGGMNASPTVKTVAFCANTQVFSLNQNYYDITNGQMADLDWLLYNAPIEYASLALSGEMENYLRGPALHGIED